MKGSKAVRPARQLGDGQIRLGEVDQGGLQAREQGRISALREQFVGRCALVQQRIAARDVRRLIRREGERANARRQDEEEEKEQAVGRECARLAWRAIRALHPGDRSWMKMASALGAAGSVTGQRAPSSR